MNVPTTALAVTVASVDGVTATGVHWRMGSWRTAGDVRGRHELARRWARELVTGRLGRDWEGFAPREPGRKPRLLASPGVDVSISHGDDTLLVAVVGSGLVGADVEDEPFTAFDAPSLIRRMCSPAELTELAALAGRDVPWALRRRVLAGAWTVKEARLKARGVGLAEDPRSVEVDLAGLAAGAAASGPAVAIVHLVDGRAVVEHPGNDEAPSAWEGAPGGRGDRI
ncbi:4'-phosphopantetheinyl transferase family protein [Agromyces sp. NPDC057865]|uniref:4'-phosphopantetheinyl transferase family protein n=1 Tax=Agromyces sp. NPDC057865 TaxID=3346267 RepID=UPI00366AFD97